MKILKIAALVGLTAVLAGCMEDDATVASRNVSKAADNFEVVRNIVFYNVWTDTEVVSVEGLCSIEIGKSRLAVLCKEGPGEFKKHYLGRSDNLTFFAQQLETTKASVYHTRITWKPQSILPDVDFRGDSEELVTNTAK